ncbi:MAG: D-alanine--D-alanine ligase [Opitutales bacterium]|nr:D-alanine--D-alanine ligase [Opitutales bacterium]
MSLPSPTPVIAVLCGGPGAECEVSRNSGRAVYEALAPRMPAELHDLAGTELPASLNPATHIVLPVIHGTFGEDGQLQALLDQAGFHYAGCDAAASCLCIDKMETKRVVAAAGLPVIRGWQHGPAAPLDPAAIDDTGMRGFIAKPRAEGSSVGLTVLADRAALLRFLAQSPTHDWVIEERIIGCDVTVGILDGEPMGVIGIHPEGGLYDYQRKYTAGQTRYEVPAVLPDDLTEQLRAASAKVFAACGCRDFARVDWMLSGARQPFFLEVNTLPGMTATSLFPKSASVSGIDFPTLVERMVAGARHRHAHPFHPRPVSR